MAKPKNILFIMFDQLRWDYRSCYGHEHLHTPNIDRLAGRGVRFTRAYIQSPICGSSRMSTYTGRYVHSHGASSNGVPLKVGEMTMGDHLRRAGMDCYLVVETRRQSQRSTRSEEQLVEMRTKTRKRGVVIAHRHLLPR